MNTKLLDRFNLTGRTALVTGAGSGMGRYFAQILSEAGATVMIAARNEARLLRVADEITAITARAVHVCKVDLEDREAAADLARHAQRVMGGLDILVCNAATDLYGTTDQFDDAVFDTMMTVNFDSNVWMTRVAVPAMKEKRWGRIIYITSVVSEIALNNVQIGLYASSKAALDCYARFAAAELGGFGITVNSLAPGAVKSELSDVVFANAPDLASYQSALNTANRFAQPEEMAGALLLLASEAGSYINGVRYLVDAGWSMMGDTLNAAPFIAARARQAGDSVPSTDPAPR
jgi:NAD(P)-dependent dehydrogenase (short-subunit alcohol dehydrogenase family)